MIPQETINKIFETARVEEIVSDFVELKKAGVNYKGRCPFHDEKTPSFIVSPTKGIYKCFGCGKGGNSITFLQDLQGVSYPEALRYVAEKYNIEIIEESLSPEQEKKLSIKESQFIATKFASTYFQDVLWNTEEGKIIGLSYFKERGFSEDTIKKFRLGYSPKKQNSFERAALKAGYEKDVLITSGLIGESANGKYYDKFRERIIFPIHSYNGKVIGFGGRAFNNEAKSKYLNSNESLIYEKSKVLYGISLAKQKISKTDKCFIVEGYTDVIAMHQNGIENVVSASGTALGSYQINLIKRSTNNIVLLFDSDSAGIKATIRSIDLCLKLEMNVKIASFPDGEDPDSYSKKLTTNEFQEYIKKNAINFVDYLINIYELKTEKDPAKIIDIKKKIILSISQMPDSFSREEYCKMFHPKLELSEKTLLEQINKARKIGEKEFEKNLKQERAPLIKEEKIINTTERKLYKLEEEVLRILINYGDEKFVNTQGEEESVASMILHELQEDNIKFSKEQHEKLYTEIITVIKQEGLIDTKKLINNPNAEISKKTIDLIAQAHNLSENWSQKHNIITERENEKMCQTTEKAILSLKKGIVELKIHELQQKIKIGDITKNQIKQLNELIKIKTKISKLLGRNVG